MSAALGVIVTARYNSIQEQVHVFLMPWDDYRVRFNRTIGKIGVEALWLRGSGGPVRRVRVFCQSLQLPRNDQVRHLGETKRANR
jgi:hypothetical protein